MGICQSSPAAPRKPVSVNSKNCESSSIREEAEMDKSSLIHGKSTSKPASDESSPNSNAPIVQDYISDQIDREIVEEDEVISFVYLFSSPLIAGFDPLNSNEEIERLKEVLRLASKKSKAIISFEALVATSSNRLEAFKSRPTILYISSHCDKTGDALFMEDSEGVYQKWTAERIQKYFETSSGIAHRQRPIQCAIVGACFSEDFAKLFMENGNIRHVVTVKKFEDVSDCAMSAFVRIFLENVLQNKPVQHSFKAAWLILGDDGRYCKEADKFVLYQKEGFEGESISIKIKSSGKRGYVCGASSSCQFLCKEQPIHCIDSDMNLLQKMYNFLSHNRRALAVLLAQRGYGSTTMAIRLAHHLKHRQVFRGIYYIPLENYIEVKGIQLCEERDIVRCIVESLSNSLRGLDSCETFADLVAALTENLISVGETDGEDGDRSSRRILFIFDGCCVGEQFALESNTSTSTSANSQLKTTLVAKLISQFLTLSSCVSALAICHEEVSFPLEDAGITQDFVELGPMSDLNMAKLLLRDAARRIQLEEYVSPQQYEDEFNVGCPTEMQKAARAEMIFSQSPIIKELQGMPAAARIFSRHIKQKSLADIGYYVELAKQSVASAGPIRQPSRISNKPTPRLYHQNRQKPRRSGGASPLSPDEFLRRVSGSSDISNKSLAEFCTLIEFNDGDWSETLDDAEPISSTSNVANNAEQCDEFPDGCSEVSMQTSVEDFQRIFQGALRTFGLANPQPLDRASFSELSSTRRGDQLMFDRTKFQRVCDKLLYLAGVYPDLFGTSIALVHYFTRVVAEQRLNGKYLLPGNCLLRLCDDGPSQLTLSWIMLEGGEHFMDSINIFVEKGPKFICRDKEYGDLNRVIRESGGGSLRYLYPNILIERSKDLENLRGWNCSGTI